MLDKLKSYLESIKITPISWLVGVSGVLVVRFFLESLSNPTSSGFFASDASTLVHYYLFFMAGLLIFMLLFQMIVPEWKNVAPQLIALSSVAVFIAPIIDWIVSGGKGLKMTYLFVESKNIVPAFLSIGGPDIYSGATIGLKIEIVLAVLFFGIFVYQIKKSWWKAIVSSLLIYLSAFALAILPVIVSAIGQAGHIIQINPISFFQNSIAGSSAISNNIHSTLQYSSVIRMVEIAFNFMMGKILLLISLAAISAWFYANFKEKFKAVIRNSRAERVASYIIMVLFGIFIAHTLFPSIKLNWNDWLSVIVLCFSFYFSCMFAICANDMADEDTDKISNADRPLISNALTKWDMKQMGAVFLLISLISGFLAGYTSFFFVLTFTALYYIYSVPPTRLKLIPFFSSFLISLCMLSVIIAGFFLVSPVKYVSVFPDKLILAIVVIFSLLANVRDMKDVAGDKSAGIKTVPVIFGDIWGPRITALFAMLAFILIPIFSGIYILFISAIPTALASWYYINKKPYSEKPLDRVYFAFMFVSFLLLFI